MPTHEPRTTKLDLRLSPETKARLNAAARERHQSVSQFVLSSAIDRADETLAARQRFTLDADQWAVFLAALDAPARDLPRLERLFREPAPFDSPEAE